MIKPILIVKSSLKAKLLRFSSTQCLQYAVNGNPSEVVQLQTLPLKPLEADNVRVKMLAAPINPADINIIQGVYPVKPPLPAVGGSEGVGQVIQIGSAVSSVNVGDWVIPSEPGHGTWCSVATFPSADHVIKIRSDLPVLAAAQLAVNPCTAYRMLKDFQRNMTPGELVVQNGGNSGVGQCVIQLCKEMGLTSVSVIRDRPNLNGMKQLLKDLGANYVLTEEEFKGQEGKRLWTKHGSPRLALNCVGGKSTLYLSSALAEGGKLVSYGGMSKQPLMVPVGPLIFKRIELHGFWMTRWNADPTNKEERMKMLEYLTSLIANKRFVSPDCETNKLGNFQVALAKSLEGFSKKQMLLFD